MMNVSLILNIHNETSYLRRTLRSCEEAARYAGAAGLTVELVMVLDRSPPATRAWVAAYRSDAFAAVQAVEVDNGSLGLSRNDGVRRANGTYITTCDADDLMSFNSIVGMVETARQVGRKAIVFPEYLAEFGAKYNVVRYFDLRVVTPFLFLEFHPYLSRICVHRDIFAELNYEDARLSDGYAYEDWHFNCEALAAGYDFVTAPRTVLFYRKRANSLLSAADRQSVRQIRPSRLFVPSVYRALCHDYMHAFRAVGGELPERPVLPAGAPTNAGPFLGSTLFRELMHKANRIDPAVDIHYYEPNGFWSPAMDSFRAGMLYYEACGKLRDDPYTDVFLLPFLVTGGAEKFLIQVMDGLCCTNPETRLLIICGQANPKAEWLDRLPPGTTVIDLWNLGLRIWDEQVDVVTLKIIQSVGTTARIHMKPSEFTHRFFRRFRSVLKANEIVYYRFSDGRYIHDGRFYTDRFGFDFISDCLEEIDLLVSDHQRLVELDRDRFGVDPHKWAVLSARCDLTTTVDAAATRASVRHNRLLWASRIDREKRPDLLLLIDDELQRRKLPVILEMYGRSVLDGVDPTIFDARPGLSYQGPFTDFGAIEHGRYDGFVYTTLFDGLPNVVLEAMAAGLPVIAPDCDGLPEVVRPGGTGFLVPNLADDLELAAAYCDAIQALCEDTERRVAMSRNCVDLVESRHSAAAYYARVAEIFGGKHGH